MNKEEAYNLKAGQEIFVKAWFSYINSQEEVRCTTKETDGKEWTIYSNISNVFTALPTGNEEYAENKPKYDPCRLFKEGDIVRYVERYGRSYVDAPPVGATCRVIVGEDKVGMVTVEFKFSENEEPAVHDVPFYHLELVTPVEELESYSIDPANTNVLFKCGKKFATFEDDDEAQELCDRLNRVRQEEQEALCGVLAIMHKEIKKQ